MSSAILYVAIVAIWAGVLIPRWLRRDSSAEERDVMRTYAMGVNSYIIKPVDFEQFTESVRDIGKYWLVINHPND